MFTVLEKLFGLRSAPADELAGLDVPELGVLGYQPDVHPESR
jgi:Amt family ammonium transporter